MKQILLTALLLSGAAMPTASAEPVSSSGLPSGANVVREFVRNDAADAWTLTYDWLWADGVLTHYPSMGTGTVQQVTMPTFTAGKLYRIDITFSGWLRGSVTLALGNNSLSGYGQDGAYTFHVPVTDPDARLSVTPTLDYEGSISAVRVVELGDEMVGGAVTKWSPDGKFEDAEGNALMVEQLGVMSGHTYQVSFAVSQSTENVPGATVALGKAHALFSNNGKYSIDVVADHDGRLVFAPQQLDVIYDGAVGAVSVREITSDVRPQVPVSNR